MIARPGVAFLFAAAAFAGVGGPLPLVFEENRGQTDARAQFLARSMDHTVFLTEDGAVLRFDGGAVRLRFDGRRAALEGLDRQPGISTYLGARRAVGVPQFAKVRYRGVWRGIDAIFYGTG